MEPGFGLYPILIWPLDLDKAATCTNRKTETWEVSLSLIAASFFLLHFSKSCSAWDLVKCPPRTSSLMVRSPLPSASMNLNLKQPTRPGTCQRTWQEKTWTTTELLGKKTSLFNPNLGFQCVSKLYIYICVCVHNQSINIYLPTYLAS